MVLRRFWSVCAARVVVVAGCSSVEEPESFIRPPFPEDEQSASVGSFEGKGAESDGDVLMSGRYRVASDGKLLRPQEAPIPDKPVYPEEAYFETPEGAEAFIRDVIDSYEYMIVSGETEAFEEIAVHECGWCTSHVESARNLRAEGGWVEKAGLQILELQEPFSIPEHEETWNSHVTLQQDELVGYNGTKVGSNSARETRLRFQIRFDNGQWNVWKVLSVD